MATFAYPHGLSLPLLLTLAAFPAGTIQAQPNDPLDPRPPSAGSDPIVDADAHPDAAHGVHLLSSLRLE